MSIGCSNINHISNISAFGDFKMKFIETLLIYNDLFKQKSKQYFSFFKSFKMFTVTRFIVLTRLVFLEQKETQYLINMYWLVDLDMLYLFPSQFYHPTKTVLWMWEHLAGQACVIIFMWKQLWKQCLETNLCEFFPVLWFYVLFIPV